MARLIFKTKVALSLWLKHGIQWPWLDQYMKFGPIMAWQMAGDIWEFRRRAAPPKEGNGR